MTDLANLPTDTLAEILWYLTGSEKNILRHVNKELSEVCVKYKFFDTCQYANTGNISVIEWAYNMGYKLDRKVGVYAAVNGYIDLLKWLKHNKFTLDGNVRVAAAGGGHIEILKWLDSESHPRLNEECVNAANYGQVDTLKWMIDNKYNVDNEVCISAASGWCYNPFVDVTGMNYGPSQCFIQCEYNAGNVKVLELLVGSLDIQSNILDAPPNILYAVNKGWFDVMEWLDKHTVQNKVDTPCNAAASNGRLDILEWLQNHGYPISINVCKRAASGGYLHILEWLKTSNLPWSDDIIYEASCLSLIHI